jgi:hypothetical protein
MEPNTAILSISLVVSEPRKMGIETRNIIRDSKNTTSSKH